MLQPRQSTVRDPGTPPPPPKSAPGASRTDRQLGDRVKSLSLASLPERQTSLWSNLAWLGGLAAIGFAVWYYFSGSRTAPNTEPPSARSATPKTEANSPSTDSASHRSAEP